MAEQLPKPPLVDQEEKERVRERLLSLIKDLPTFVENFREWLEKIVAEGHGEQVSKAKCPLHEFLAHWVGYGVDIGDAYNVTQFNCHVGGVVRSVIVGCPQEISRWIARYYERRREHNYTNQYEKILEILPPL